MKSSSLQRVDIITLFPQMFAGPLSESLIGKARERGLVDLRIVNLRDFSADEKHKTVDDRPYGGGAGMVIQAEPVYQALKSVGAATKRKSKTRPYVIYLSPQGKKLTQQLAGDLVKRPRLVLLCGHYEGIDERVMDFVDVEVSVGDVVLTGGELPAMVVADAVIRLIPGVVKEAESIAQDSFQAGLLDYPHYTRPAKWRGRTVPDVLLSGNHKNIREWRMKRAREVTLRKRPDLLTRSH
jgi:tRNA (guanine37-N1)-methyltransferase